MNLLCPQCQQTIAIADQYAGQLMKCPLCSGTFTAPALAPSVPPTASPSAAPIAEKPKIIVPESSVRTNSTSESVDGYRRTSTIWISPKVVPWVGPLALLLVFVLTFFRWLLIYDEANKAVVACGAWGLAFSHPINALTLFYLISLLVAAPLGAATLVLPRLSIALPPVLQQIMPWRSAILLAVVTMGFVFLALQLTVGFDQESANTGSVPILVTRTVWLKTCTLLHIVALIGYGLECWLAVRKSKPLPRVDFRW